MKKFGFVVFVVFFSLFVVSSFSSATEELEGTLEVIMATKVSEKTCQSVTLINTGRERIRFSMPVAAPNIKHGQKIKISGRWKEEKQKSFRCEKVEAVSVASTPTTKTESADKADVLPEQTLVLGEQRTLAVAVVFPDHSAPLFGKKEIEDTVFYHPYSNNFLWKECSGEKMWTTGKCLEGWRGMSKTATAYGYGSEEERNFFIEMINDLIDEADKEADFTQYDRLIFVRSGRGWGYAFSTLGKWSFSTNDGQVKMSVAVVDERFGLAGNIVLSHEYGHGLGLLHNGNKIVTTGQVDSYGDIWSVMGRGYAQIPAMHKYMLGWLNLDQIEIITESGYYWVDQRELISGGKKLLVISFSTAPPTLCFLEYFKRLGNFDSQVPIYAYDSQKDVVLLRQYEYQWGYDSLVFTDKDWVPVLALQEFCDHEVCVQVTQKIGGETPGAKAEVKITLPPPPPPPPPCEAEKIAASPPILTLKIGETGDIAVSLTGAESCPVEGTTVTATVVSGKKRVFIPFLEGETDENGTVIFNITGRKKGRATVLFQASNLKILATVKVVKK